MNKLLLSFCLLLVSFVASVQDRLPKVMLKDIEGKTIQTDTISSNGKPLIIVFFTTWCKPCNRELTSIGEVYDDWQQETGVRLVIVSIDQVQNANKVKLMVDQNGWRYDVLLDPNGEFRRSLGIQSVSYTVLLDGQGKIVYKHNGYTDSAEVELYKKVEEAAGK